ncbi:hypothetical protein ACHAP5_011126 [Fusarium lateritium]
MNRAVPKDEEDWRLARQNHAFSTPAEMVKTLEDLLDGEKKSQLYKTVYLASRYAILHGDSSQKKTVYPDLRKCLDNPNLKDNMLDIYMDSVVKLVKALDDLFLKGLLHRAFELVLYNITPASLRTPTRKIRYLLFNPEASRRNSRISAAFHSLPGPPFVPRTQPYQHPECIWYHDP